MSLTDLRDVITYMEAAIRDRDQLMIDLDNAGKENHQLRNDLTACQLERDRLKRDLEEVTCGDPRMVCPTCKACHQCGRTAEVCAKLGMYGLGSKCCERCSHVPQGGDHASD